LISKVKTLIAANKSLIRFLVFAFLLLFGWVFFASFFPSAVADLHYFVIRPQADICAYFLKLMGYDLVQEYMVADCEAVLTFPNNGFICIGKGCSGLELFLLFFGFIFLMKGRLVDKLWFVPLGALAILVLNIIRIIALSVIYYHHPEYLEFNHKYTFVIIVYGAIFGLWVLWINKFANRSPES
jgi:exosortase family protein XrtF